MTRDYVLDQGFAEERARIAGMEALWDRGSQALLEELGIGPGWKCLEVGAGGGSLVEWMAARGATSPPSTSTPASSISWPPMRSKCAASTFANDELPQAEFDLVHARLVLEHLTDRSQILDRLAATLRPGGWIVIEDYDWGTFGFEDEEEGFSDVTEALLQFMEQAGFEREYGRQVVADIASAGLTEVRGEGRVRIVDSNSPGFDFFKLTFESLRGAVVDSGLLSAEDAEAASARFGGNLRVCTPLMMAGIGRRAS